MGKLIDGQWRDDDLITSDPGGAFMRPNSTFRDRVTADGSSGLKAERGRYLLVVAYGCPWAHRTILIRKLKQLEDAIPMIASTGMGREGWVFEDEFDGIAPDANG